MKSIPFSVEILSTIEKIKQRLGTTLLVLTVLILGDICHGQTY